MVRLSTRLLEPLRLMTNFVKPTVKNGVIPWFSHVPHGPPDIILGIHDAYKRDPNPLKIDLSVGAFRDDNGEPYPLRAVLEAERRLLHKKDDNEYGLDIGSEEYRQLTLSLALGEQSSYLNDDEKQHVTVQSVSGSGSMRIGAEFLSNCFAGNKVIYLPKPSWGYHEPIFRQSGLKTEFYRYYDYTTRGLDFAGMMADISNIPEKSIILFQICGHNPTGVDPNPEQWREMSALVKKRNIMAFFDMAYQGLSSGSLDQDAFGLRTFIDDGHKCAFAQSYSKNMGLYSIRVGAISFILNHESERSYIIDNLRYFIKCIYGYPPLHGSRIVTEILTDPQLKESWLKEVQMMADRIKSMRVLLKNKLADVGSIQNWDHLTNQTGMFCYSGISSKQCDLLANKYGVYILRNGRLSVPGISSNNVEYLAKCIHEVTK